MQSKARAVGSIHGAAQTGAQGLRLKMPNMFKIAVELVPTRFHLSAQMVASHTLSIFGDHGDVLAA